MINQSADAVYVQSFTGMHVLIFFSDIILLRDKVGVTSEQLFGLQKLIQYSCGRCKPLTVWHLLLLLPISLAQ